MFAPKESHKYFDHALGHINISNDMFIESINSSVIKQLNPCQE